MAHLSERSRRGQILLVTGFALAVAFVGLALVLNSVIFTENLATRSESTTTSDAIAHANSVEQATEVLVAYVNTYNTTNSSSYDSVDHNITRGFENVSSVTTQHQLYDGQVVNDTLLGYDNGTLIQQTNGTRNFTSDDGYERNWEVATSANGARAFRMHVISAPDLDDGGIIFTSPDEFSVTVVNNSDTYELNLTDTGAFTSDIEVRFDGPSATATCGSSTAGSAAWVNVTEGTFRGDECDAVRMFRDRAIDNADQITFRAGNLVEE